MALPYNLPPDPPGFSDFLFKFGRASSIATGVESMLWNGGGAYNGVIYGGAQNGVYVVSTSAADTLTGLGAGYVTFAWQDADLVETFQTVELNGLTPVLVDIPAEVSYRAFVSGLGDAALANPLHTELMSFDGANVGDITLYDVDDPTKIMWKISAGEGQTLMCFYRVPGNKILELTNSTAFPIGNKETLMRIRAKSSIYHPWRNQAVADALVNPVSISIPDLPQLVGPGAVICITAETTQVGTNVSAYFSGKLSHYAGVDYYDGLGQF